MFTPNDIAQIEARGLSLAEVERQIENFRQGFPSLPVVRAASVDDGIKRLNNEELKAALKKIETITVYSGADIEAAQAAYTAFTNWLADLEYVIDGLADTATITNTLATQTVKFNNLVAEAVANRETYLATVKQRNDEYKASRAAAPAIAATNDTFNF